MQEIHRGERLVVIDDFLPLPALSRLRDIAKHVPYSDVDSVVDARVDGSAMRSRGGVIDRSGSLPNDGVSEAMGAIRACIADHPEIYGAAGVDWRLLSFSLWQYAAGTRLGWHNDAGNGRTGEFILYLHDAWRPSWGGELIVLDAFCPLDMARLNPQERFAAVEDIVAAAASPLVAIQPRPNRLVMVRAGTCHYINRVDRAAGPARRHTLTGFASLPASRAGDGDRKAQLEALLGWNETGHAVRTATTGA